jgi:hypothetical protein
MALPPLLPRLTQMEGASCTRHIYAAQIHIAFVTDRSSNHFTINTWIDHSGEGIVRGCDAMRHSHEER